MDFSKGCIHIYCGDGKGKTTAAIGLGVRAAGNGLKVLVIQFLKAGTSGEINILQSIPGVEVLKGPDKMKFTNDMSPKEKQQAAKDNIAKFEYMRDIVSDYDVVILDEILYAISADMFPETMLLEFLENKNGRLEVVLTGQKPGKKLMWIADYVSEIKKIKHPYDKGVKSRRGIEK